MVSKLKTFFFYVKKAYYNKIQRFLSFCLFFCCCCTIVCDTLGVLGNEKHNIVIPSTVKVCKIIHWHCLKGTRSKSLMNIVCEFSFLMHNTWTYNIAFDHNLFLFIVYRFSFILTTIYIHSITATKK